MILNKKHTILLLILFLASFTFSQEIKKEVNDSTKTNELEEVIISATRTKRQLSSLPLPAQIISKKEISNTNTVRLSDILNEQTGIITISDFGGGEGVQLQGLDSQYTLILIDGVPLVGRSAGTLDLSRVTVGNIKQIEIVKGASSSLYGSEALGGVINIITETPKNGFNGHLNHRTGTFDTHDTSLGLTYKKNKLAISTHINRYSSEGFDLIEGGTKTVEPFENYTFNPKISYKFNSKTNASLSFRYYLQDQDNVAISNDELLTGDSKLREWNSHLKINHQFNSKWDTYLELYATRYKADEFLNTPDGSSFDSSFFNQLLIRPEARATYTLNDNHQFTGGIGWNHETLDRSFFSTNPTFDSQYVYAQYDGNYFEDLNVIVGARFDNHSEYQSQFSPKLALRYNITHKIAIKGSVGYGYKAPDFRQLYFDFTNSTVGYTVLGYNAVQTRIPELQQQGQINTILVPISNFNDELKPESSVSFNVGFQYTPVSNLKLEANLFRNNISDLIDTRVIASKTNGQNVFSYYNVNKVYTQGAEFNFNWKPFTALKVSGGYQYLIAKDKEVVNDLENGINAFARDPNTLVTVQLQKSDYFGLFNRSKHMANLKIYYDFQKWGLNTNIRTTYRSKYGLSDSNGNGYLDTYDPFVDGYFITDWAINKTLYKHYELGLGIDNVFDFTDPQNISNISGQLFYGKLRIQF